MVISQYQIYWTDLEPTRGGEINKTRPCVIISPDEMNKFLRTVLIAPLTHTIKEYPSRVNCKVNGDTSAIVLDQMRTIDKSRLIKFIDKLNDDTIVRVKSVINEMLC